MSDGSKCPLCGARWDPDDACRGSCPMSSGCTLVRCPNCGWEAPDVEQSSVVKLIRRFFGGQREERTHDPR